MTDTTRGPGRDPSRRAAQVVEVATAYYHERLDQEQIARRMGISRSTVSRMLAEALDTGVVEIRVRGALPIHPGLQRDLVETLGLQDAMVLATREDEDCLADLGRLAARRLDARLADGDILAISWGTAVRATVEGFDPRTTRDVEVVQMIGGAGSRDPQVDGTELARRLAGALGGRFRYLNAPLVVAEEAVAAGLRREPAVRETLAAAAAAGLALVGIGTFLGDRSSFVRSGHLAVRHLAELRAAGAVGDVAGHIVAEDGRLLDPPLSRRIVTIDVADLRRIPTVLAVASGPEKVAAILGTIRAGLVDALVTDDRTAAALLRSARTR